MDGLKISGHVKYELRDSNGNVKDTWENKNLVVTVGKNYLAAWLVAASQAGYFMQFIQLGEGTAAPTASDTVLETPLTPRVAGTLSSSTSVWTNVAVFAPGVATGNLTEAGLFSLTTGGTMFSRQVFSLRTKQAGDTLTVTWNLTLL
jgi:hypothetical protein